ncbi:hypothetical protein LQF12_05850 [Ruania suaedae]|uniref:hypothetical protein n=1 Tax=Ruania suaedae TaxID=2897774 RepID=UPI001E377D20|nr:hypothetical protein [Ruania suaedae]UFU04109.1 hypothetical protein LQF12_05850 [Ruania suaedae]
MSEKSTLLRAVAALKPAEREVSEAESTALLERVNAQIADGATPLEEARRLAPQPPPATTRRILAGAAAAGLIAVGAITLGNQDPPMAYADWTPVPTELRPAEIDEITQVCPDTMLVAPADVDPPAITPILAEQRGDYQVLLSAAESGAYQFCMLLPDEDSDLGYRPHIDGYLPGGSSQVMPSAPDGVYSLSAGEPWNPSPDHGAMTMVVGTVGEDVSELEIRTENGSFAEATVNEGWFLVWFPDAVELTETATVTTDDGEEREVTIERPGG